MYNTEGVKDKIAEIIMPYAGIYNRRFNPQNFTPQGSRYVNSVSCAHCLQHLDAKTGSCGDCPFEMTFGSGQGLRFPGCRRAMELAWGPLSFLDFPSGVVVGSPQNPQLMSMYRDMKARGV